jgi:4-amino-4-deoxy-L-arabinose transferase-like glycosyltransferase
VLIPLLAVLSLPPLLWFGPHWTVYGNDTGRYLLAGLRFTTGESLEDLNTISEYNGGHGPGLPVLVGSLMLLFGRNTVVIVWVLRLISLLNPLLAYFLVKRISTPVAGLIAAALVSLLAFNVRSPVAINIDAVQLTFYLLSLLALLGAVERGGTLLALLSGVLLGITILTKATAIVDLPLALLAVLLLDWDVRGALWHYLGVALVCLPWWVLAYLATGEVYLVGQLPTGLRISMLVAAVAFVVVAVVAYVSGAVDRYLAGVRRRRWSGIFLAVAWTILLSGMLLTTASYALGEVSLGALRLFLVDLLAPVTVVVPALLAVIGYAARRAFRGGGAWRLLALAMLFQVPVCLLLTVQRWAPRQFLVPQTLVFCVLAALLVAAGAAAWRGRGAYRMVAAGGTAVLAVLVLVSCVQTVRALLPEDLSGGFTRHKRAAPLEEGMVEWMNQNVPAGERILVVSEAYINVPEANYLMYLDGGRHEWTSLRLDQKNCVPRPNVQINCDPDQNDVSKIPPDALWLQTIGGGCKVLSLSASNLMQQSRQSGADYLATTTDRASSDILELPPALRASGATTLAYARISRAGPQGGRHGVVLQRIAEQPPETAPARMNVNTMSSLSRCERAQGPGYEDRIRSLFPHGMVVTNPTTEPASPHRRYAFKVLAPFRCSDKIAKSYYAVAGM